MKAYDDCVWKKDKLYLDDIHWCTIVPDKEVKGMCRILWMGDKSYSMDYFNKSRVKDNAQKMVVFLNNLMEEHVRGANADPPSDLKTPREP